ncbi:hypothetical protein IM774_02695, partial [Erysipelotrichaceae bacterium RD49]|nr:hypothetical protein [Erysipelotrichaceae bacterium RD49]
MNAKKKQELISDLRILKDINMKPNYAALARKYDMDYRTVKKYFENGGQVPKRKNREQFSRWDPYAGKIQQLLQQNGATIRGIHEYFRETLSSDQLPGTYSSLKAYIQKK